MSEIVKIKTGYYSSPLEQGEVMYVQARQFDNWGNTIGGPEAFLPMDKKTEAQLLSEGDVLLVAKGFRFFASTYRSEWGPAVASSLFFVLKPNPTIILPDYLTLYLNLPKSMNHFKQLSAGSSQPSIRMGELLEYPIAVPPLEEQRRFIEFANTHFQEIRLLQSLIKQKEQLFASIATTLLQA